LLRFYCLWYYTHFVYHMCVTRSWNTYEMHLVSLRKSGVTFLGKRWRWHIQHHFLLEGIVLPDPTHLFWWSPLLGFLLVTIVVHLCYPVGVVALGCFSGRWGWGFSLCCCLFRSLRYLLFRFALQFCSLRVLSKYHRFHSLLLNE
jgi:hypothetical protein